MKNIFRMITAIFAMMFFSMTMFDPNILASNTFLDKFVGAELIALLSLILTITLASVANIHLALNRIIKDNFKDVKAGYAAAMPVRREINSNAWLLFVLFIFSVAAIVMHGWFSENIYLESFVYGIELIVLVLNICVLYDIYRSVYELVEIGGEDEEDPNFTA